MSEYGRVHVHVDVHVQMSKHGLSGHIDHSLQLCNLEQEHCVECNVLCAFLVSLKLFIAL